MVIVITPLQIVVVLFALFALSRTVLRFKDGNINKKELAFWSSIWIALIVVVFLPGIAGGLAEFLGIGRTIDVLVYAAIVLLFYLIFKLYVKLETIEQEITTIVRKVALRKKKR